MKKAYTFNHNPLLSERLPVWRARLVLLALLGASLSLTVRAMYLQGVNKEFLQAKGESRYERVLELPANRGRILDRHGEPLAMSSPVKSVWAIPEEARLAPPQVRELARLLDMDVAELNRKLASERDFVFIKRAVSPEVAQRVAALKLPGLHQENDFRRFYPNGEVAAHLVGFTDIDERGQEGIELALERQLQGRVGSRRVIRDRRGSVVDDVGSIRRPQDGRDIHLALDAKIQYLAYSALRDAVAQHKARAGGVVVLDARTGEVLAMVNNPTYNPNNRVGLSGAQLRNRALTDTFEPGSTLKPFTIGLALEQGKVRADTEIDTAPGRMTIGSATIHDAHPHGRLTVAGVLQKSSNIGTAKIALGLSSDAMWRMYDSAGFGAAPGLGFPGEAGGRLRPARNWRPIEQATMSYGHGISVSLMQLAHSYMVFARDGDMVPLSLTKLDAPPLHGKAVFSPQTARELRAMLEAATSSEGTAPLAQVPGYRVAGKTGTAHKLEGGHYARKYVASFVGFAPASDPRLIVAVMVDEPNAGQYYGGLVAAPVFSRIMGGALRALGVPADAPLRPLQVARQGLPSPQVEENM